MKRLPLVLAASGVAAAALAVPFAPDPPQLSATTAGDPALAAQVLAAVSGEHEGFRGLSVAVIDGGRTTTATLGDPAGGSLFEIGSVTKTLTGMLFADLVADGTVRREQTLGETLPGIALKPATASITLEELASQRSGLPRLSPGAATYARSLLAGVTGGDPYAAEDVDAVFDAATRAEPDDGRGDIGYSNFGMALLGHALASQAGKPWPELVEERILHPLGMADTVLTVSDPPPAEPADGSTATGRSAEAWSGSGYAPAGVGPRSTATDLSRLVAAAMAGTAPGADAAQPRFAAKADDDDRIGYAWFTNRYAAREITWHNGGTGGFRSYVGFDRAQRKGVVVLGNTDRSVDAIGLRLLGAEPPEGADDPPGDPVHTGVTIALLGWAAAALLLTARTAQRRLQSSPAQAAEQKAPSHRAVWWESKPDRLRAVGTVLSTAACLGLLHRIGAWLVVDPLLWALAAGFAGAGLVAVASAWRGLPIREGGPAWFRWPQLALSGAISLGVLLATF